MREPANRSSFQRLLVAGGIAVAGLLLAARPAHAAGSLVAVMHPVDQATGKVDSSVSLGTVKFTQGKDKVDVLAQLNGVSVAGGEAIAGADGQGSYYPHGIHIHDGNACGSTTDKDGKLVPGGEAGPHFDPKKTGSHKGPDGDGHAGDLPNIRVLSDGTAILMTSTTRLTLDQLAGRTVILHANRDNYTDTPVNGGSGARIACGMIQASK